MGSQVFLYLLVQLSRARPWILKLGRCFALICNSLISNFDILRPIHYLLSRFIHSSPVKMPFVRRGVVVVRLRYYSILQGEIIFLKLLMQLIRLLGLGIFEVLLICAVVADAFIAHAEMSGPKVLKLSFVEGHALLGLSTSMNALRVRLVLDPVRADLNVGISDELLKLVVLKVVHEGFGLVDCVVLGLVLGIVSPHDEVGLAELKTHGCHLLLLVALAKVVLVVLLVVHLVVHGRIVVVVVAKIMVVFPDVFVVALLLRMGIAGHVLCFIFGWERGAVKAELKVVRAQIFFGFLAELGGDRALGALIV